MPAIPDGMIPPRPDTETPRAQKEADRTGQAVSAMKMAIYLCEQAGLRPVDVMGLLKKEPTQ